MPPSLLTATKQTMTLSPIHSPSPRQFTLPPPAAALAGPSFERLSHAPAPAPARPNAHASHARTLSLPHWPHSTSRHRLYSPPLAPHMPASARPPSVPRFASWPPVPQPMQSGFRADELAAMYTKLAARWGETAKRIEDGRICRPCSMVGMKRARSGADVGEGSPAKVARVGVQREAEPAEGEVDLQAKKEAPPPVERELARSASPEAAPRRSARQAFRHQPMPATRTPVSDCRGRDSTPSPTPAATTAAPTAAPTDAPIADLGIIAELTPAPAAEYNSLPAAAPTLPAGDASSSTPPLTLARSAALLAVVKSFEAVLGCRAESWRRLLEYQRGHDMPVELELQVGPWSA